MNLTGKAPVMTNLVGNVMAGGGLAFGVLGLMAVANVITTYISGGKTLTGLVDERTGLTGGM